MNTREELVANFYQGEGLTAELYELIGSGEIAVGGIQYKYDGDDHAFDGCQAQLEEVAQSTRLVRTPPRSFVISEANLHAPPDNAILHIATYSSGIPGNAGNAREFAAQAARYPDLRHVYITPPGIESSTPLTQNERKYAADTGRFTWQDRDGKTVPMPTFESMNQALEQEGIRVTRIGTDSSGGNHAMALGLAMPEGQLSHVFASERPGFVNLSTFAIAKAMLVDENLKNSKENRALGGKYDPECLTDEMTEDAKKALEAVKDTPSMKKVLESKVGHKAITLWANLHALRRGPDDIKDPKAFDTNAFIRQQVDARLTFGVAERDPLYKSPDMARYAAQRLLQRLIVPSGNGDVAAVVIPEMTHAYNTHFPGLHHAIKREAFGL